MKTTTGVNVLVAFIALIIGLSLHQNVTSPAPVPTQAAAQAPAPIVVYVPQQPSNTTERPSNNQTTSTGHTEQNDAVKAPKKAQKPATKTSKAQEPTKATKAPSNEELAYRIDQLAEDTCERRAGGTVAEDYTCVNADFHSKDAAKATPKTNKTPATNAATVALGEGKKRCPAGYTRDTTDRSLCVAKA